MNKRMIFIMSAWIVFAMRVGFSSVMMWAFYDTTNQALRITLLCLVGLFLGNAINQIVKAYDFLKKLDTLNLTIE
jgi:hypothetical protein